MNKIKEKKETNTKWEKEAAQEEEEEWKSTYINRSVFMIKKTYKQTQRHTTKLCDMFWLFVWLSFFSSFLRCLRRENKLKTTKKLQTKNKHTRNKNRRDKIRCMRFSSIRVSSAMFVELYGIVSFVCCCYCFFFVRSFFLRHLRSFFTVLVNLLIAYSLTCTIWCALVISHSLVSHFQYVVQFFFGFINFQLFNSAFFLLLLSSLISNEYVCIRPECHLMRSHLFRICGFDVTNLFCSKTKSKADNFSKCVFCCCCLIMFYVFFFGCFFRSVALFCSSWLVIFDYFFISATMNF